MISSVRSFGAPVIEPAGKGGAHAVDRVGVLAQAAADHGHHLVDGGVRLDDHEPRDSTVPKRETRPRSLRTRSAIMRFSARVFSSRRSSAARQASSNGLRQAARRCPSSAVDSTVRSAVDAQEPLRGGAEHGEVAEPQQRRERGGVAGAQRPVGGQRIEGPSLRSSVVRQIS